MPIFDNEGEILLLLLLCGGLNVHTLHTRWVAIKVHLTTDTCNSDLVLNEMLELEKIE